MVVSLDAALQNEEIISSPIFFKLIHFVTIVRGQVSSILKLRTTAVRGEISSSNARAFLGQRLGSSENVTNAEFISSGFVGPCPATSQQELSNSVA